MKLLSSTQKFVLVLCLVLAVELVVVLPYFGRHLFYVGGTFFWR